MSSKISLVLRFPNDMVAVFNERGEQVPEYQGRYGDVRDKVLSDAPKGCRFETFRSGFVEVGRDEW